MKNEGRRVKGEGRIFVPLPPSPFFPFSLLLFPFSLYFSPLSLRPSPFVFRFRFPFPLPFQESDP